MSKRQASLLSFVNKPAKRNNSLQSEPSPSQSLAESVDDHESQSTVVATAVNTATADVQSVVAQSPSPSSSTPSSSTPSTTTTTTTEVSVGATPPTTSSQSPSLPEDIAKSKNEKPAQPEGMTYPIHTCGTVKRSFQPNWYHIYPWLEYSVERDSVYCFPCRFFGSNVDKRLCYSGYSDWKHAKGKRGTLTIHETSQKHREAVLSWKDYQSTIDNNSSVANQLVSVRRKQVDENRQYVMHLMEALLYCGQQGIAIRGHRETEEVESSINVGNYLNLLKLQSRHMEFLRKRLESGPKNASLLGHDYQNSMLQVLAESVLDYIRDEVRAARYYTILIDETKDISKKEQMTFVLRYALKGVIHERFISYTHCEELNAAALTEYIYKALDSVGLHISNCVSQCYDGASVMSGVNTGVKTRIQQDNPRAIYIHCHAHQLNLALVDTCRTLPHASDFFSLLESLYVFMSSSVPHSVLLKKQQDLNQSCEEDN